MEQIIPKSNKYIYNQVRPHTKNGEVADIVILKDSQPVAFGKYFSELILPSEDNKKEYFSKVVQGKGCDWPSRLWFYFNEDNMIINDLKWTLPHDELMSSSLEFYKKLTEEQPK